MGAGTDVGKVKGGYGHRAGNQVPIDLSACAVAARPPVRDNSQLQFQSAGFLIFCGAAEGKQKAFAPAQHYCVGGRAQHLLQVKRVPGQDSRLAWTTTGPRRPRRKVGTLTLGTTDQRQARH